MSNKVFIAKVRSFFEQALSTVLICCLQRNASLHNFHGINPTLRTHTHTKIRYNIKKLYILSI